MNGLILFAAFIFILWIGSSIFIPLLVATFLWYLINATATYYRKLFPTCDEGKCAISKPLFNLLSTLLSIATFIGLIYLFATRVRPMFHELLIAMPEIQASLNNLWTYISDTLDIDITSVALPNITTIVSSIGSSVAKLATSMGMVIVYLSLIHI